MCIKNIRVPKDVFRKKLGCKIVQMLDIEVVVIFRENNDCILVGNK